MRKICTCLLLSALVGEVSAQTADSTRQEPVKVARISSAPAIDGILDEPDWQQATKVTDFVQRIPKEGAAPTESTIVCVMYTSTALYIGARLFDSHPADIAATVMQRDNSDLTQNDQFAVAIDSYNDGRNGYWFSTNPLGVRVDVQFFDEGDIWGVSWNGLWECEARIDAKAWTVEMEIPFSTLRFHVSDGNVMGINFFRRIIRTNEQLFAPLIPLQYPNGTPNVSAARKYVFKGISGGKSLYIKPYVLAGGQKDFTEPVSSERKREWGLELRHSLADNLTANLSYNTDFAQVDADDRQINLTRFNLFFPEKREFFLESAGTFSFGIPEETELFFSRTIGLAQMPSGSTVPVPLLFGGKLTGKMGTTDIGFLNVQTSARASFPSENFGVLRLKEGIAERSYVGAIAANRQRADGSFNRSYGIDATYYATSDIGIRGFLAATHGSADSERHFKNSSAYYLSLFKQAELTSFDFALTDIGSVFKPGMGFLERGDIREWYASVTIPWYLQTPLVRRAAPGYVAKYVFDHSGFLQNYTHRFFTSISFQSDDEVSLSLSKFYELIPVPFLIFKSISVPASGYTDFGTELKVVTKPGRALSAVATLGAGEFYGGSRKDISTGVQWKASKHLTMTQEYSTSDIALPAGSFQTRIARSRLSIALNTSFFMSMLGQYDNATNEFGVNLRLKYIFAEGTELFVVLNGVLDEESGSRLLMFNRTQTSTVLLKFTYLFDV